MAIKEVKTNSSIMIPLIVTIFNTVYIESSHDKNPGIRYILIWTDYGREPFSWWNVKRTSFKQKNCQYQNCFIVKERDYFLDVTDFDAILFNPLGISEDLPLARSDNQIYVFVAVESAPNLQMSEYWNYFFNYTMTYKLDSDVTYPYFVVRNKRNQIVGPKINARWRNITMMKPAQESIIEKLKPKSTAAAWFVTNCRNKERLEYGRGISEALSKYNLNLHVYGKCGERDCPKYKFEECLGMVETTYHFYLAFENSFGEDYVTEKLMSALNHYTVPVVLGGANYSR